MDNTAIAERNKQNIVNVVKVGGACVIGFIVAPMIYMAITGLVGICIAGAIFLVGWNAFPVLVDACANMQLVGIKWAASKNPVETLQNDYIKRQANLAEYLQSIRDFTASIMTFEGKYKRFLIQYPDQKEKFDNILSNMKALLADRTEKYKDAEKSLVQYNAEIQKASAIWDMSVEAAKMNKAAGFDKNDAIEQIKTQTSFDAIEQNMNSAFADLKVSLIQNDTEKDFSKKVIDVEAVATK